MNTIATLFEKERISFDKLHKDYDPMLKIVKELIGVIPNCDQTLEIWPTGFRTYNLIVPNLLNLPASLMGGTSLKSIVGLGMYASSNAAECPYCTAHTCSYAMRRGLDAEKIKGHRTPKEVSVVTLAEALSRVPCELKKEHCVELSSHFSSYEVRWILMGIGMMGFLNKYMDVMGIPLEDEAIADTGNLLVGTGWTPEHIVAYHYETPESFVKPKADNLGTFLRVFLQAPGAIRLESKWVKGVPKKYPEAGEYLKKHTGYSFPMIAYFKAARLIRAITTVLRDNLDNNTTKIGLGTKCLAGLLFSTTVQNKKLIEEATILVNYHMPNITTEVLIKIQDVALKEIVYTANTCKQLITDIVNTTGLSKRQAGFIVLAKASSSSPAIINNVVLQEVVSLCKAEEVVELIVWISIQQMLYRLYTYYEISGNL
ncbi:hypothetical protein GCM10022393_12800 [Aquimarina addita]|uniref:Uncharacterized protein n=1 Tax=Aquimarina addita TaxID=870485 RepID=A0ABP7XEH2_9FLAO